MKLPREKHTRTPRYPHVCASSGGWSVCHSSHKGRKVPLPCSNRGTCIDFQASSLLSQYRISQAHDLPGRLVFLSRVTPTASISWSMRISSLAWVGCRAGANLAKAVVVMGRVGFFCVVYYLSINNSMPYSFICVAALEITHSFTHSLTHSLTKVTLKL